MNSPNCLEYISAGLTLILVLTTVYYAFETNKLRKAQEAMFELDREPAIIVKEYRLGYTQKFEIPEYKNKQHSRVYLVIKNTSKTITHFKLEYSLFVDSYSDLNAVFEYPSVDIMPEQEAKIDIGFAPCSYDSATGKPVRFEAKYRYSIWNRLEMRYLITEKVFITQSQESYSTEQVVFSEVVESEIVRQ